MDNISKWSMDFTRLGAFLRLELVDHGDRIVLVISVLAGKGDPDEEIALEEIQKIHNDLIAAGVEHETCTRGRRENGVKREDVDKIVITRPAIKKLSFP